MNLQAIFYAVKSVLFGFFAELAKSYGPDWEAVKAESEQWLYDSKKRLADVTSARLKGEIDDQQFLDFLKDEFKILESQALAAEVAGKAVLQGAINTAIDKLKSLVLQWLPGAVGSEPFEKKDNEAGAPFDEKIKEEGRPIQ